MLGPEPNWGDIPGDGTHPKVTSWVMKNTPRCHEDMVTEPILRGRLPGRGRMRSPEGCGPRSLPPGWVCASSVVPSALAAGGCQRARAFLNSSPGLEVVTAQPSIASHSNP